ncbi:MAG: tryptophan halogenase family protein [Cellvibrio sp.]
MSKPVNIVIVGGGTAGWMCASALAAVVGEKICTITLVESDEIASVGVGEATLPHMREFNERLGIDEADMMQQTNATFKLGIQFVDWGKMGNSYIHPFGKHGELIGGVNFHQQWQRIKHQQNVKDIDAYSYAIESCIQNKFQFPSKNTDKINSTYSYAYHFDASLYARYLRKFSEQKHVKRIEGQIISVANDPDNGNITSVTLADGHSIGGDFFIDCSGFRSLLLKQNLGSEFDDWSTWLVCDKAFAVPSENISPLAPYTRSTAKKAGWQWKIPLLHRTGNGYVFCSKYISDDEAVSSLLTGLDSKPLADPRLIKFKAGRYKKSWIKNCLAVGLSSGFLEPLESTSIYLIQVAIINFIKLFPTTIPDDALIREYHRLMDCEYERVRDFLILHYHLNQRDDSELWRYCREMDIPASLSQKITLFKHRGYVDNYKYGLFALPSWISVFNGQDLGQESIDPFALNVPAHEVSSRLDNLLVDIKQNLMTVPSQEIFIADYCRAKV